ncbi:MAG: GNAT family N-acetyltransferase [Oscillospiraceae bacterium]|nr:GNAT family N-acetyltransferase [Oscillospiraceae bacterium]
MIRLATPYDITQLKELWDASFHDPMNYIDFVFDKITGTDDVLVTELDGRVVAMLIMIPVKFVYKDEAVNTLYIFGAATDKKYQNRGIMSKLIEDAENRAMRLDARLSVLVPGNPYLFDFYRNRGYSTDFSLRCVNIKPGMLDNAVDLGDEMKIDEIKTEDLHRIRGAALMNIPHISWSLRQLSFVMEDSRMYDDHIASYQGELGNAYAFYGIRNKKLYVKEILGSTNEAQMAVLKTLIEKFSPKYAYVNLPELSKLFYGEGEIRPYGMCRSLTVKNSIRDLDAYMNLMLD